MNINNIYLRRENNKTILRRILRADEFLKTWFIVGFVSFFLLEHFCDSVVQLDYDFTIFYMQTFQKKVKIHILSQKNVAVVFFKFNI